MVNAPLTLPFFFPDVNECSPSNGGCGGACVNTDGSYTCSCDAGYVLNTDKHACNGKWIHTFILITIKRPLSHIRIIFYSLIH